MERGTNLPTTETLFRLSETQSIPLKDLFASLDTHGHAMRTALEATLIETARGLSLRDLEIVVHQIQAFPRESSCKAVGKQSRRMG